MIFSIKIRLNLGVRNMCFAVVLKLGELIQFTKLYDKTLKISSYKLISSSRPRPAVTKANYSLDNGTEIYAP